MPTTGTTKNKVLSFALEPTPGNIDPTTGLPYDDGLTFDMLRVRNSDGLDTPGDYEVTESDETTDGPYTVPGDVDVKLTITGSEVPYRTGELNVSSYYRGPKDGVIVPSLDRHSLYKILQSGLAVAPTNVNGTVDVVAGNVDVNEFEPTNVDRYDVGHLLAFQHEGTMRGAMISKVEDPGGGGDRVHYTPSLPAAATLEAAQTVRMCKTLFAATKEFMGSVGKTVAFQLGTGVTLTKGYMGRMKSATFIIDAKKLAVDTTIYFPYIIDDHASAAAPASTACQPGKPARIGACPVISTTTAPDCTDVAGAELTGSELDAIANSIKVTIENELAIDEDLQTCDGVVRLPADIEITNTTITAEFTLASLNETFLAMAVSRDHRHLLLAFGPFEEGTGLVIAIPAAHVVGDLGKVSLAKRLVTTPVQLSAGRYAGDDGDASATDPSNSPFRLGFVNIDAP